ncbi:MAG: hypothetical protein ACI8RZ_005275 [Myxococcota bacterium]|jgi:hypothetical protein
MLPPYYEAHVGVLFDGVAWIRAEADNSGEWVVMRSDSDSDGWQQVLLPELDGSVAFDADSFSPAEDGFLLSTGRLVWRWSHQTETWSDVVELPSNTSTRWGISDDRLLVKWPEFRDDVELVGLAILSPDGSMELASASCVNATLGTLFDEDRWDVSWSWSWPTLRKRFGGPPSSRRSRSSSQSVEQDEVEVVYKGDWGVVPHNQSMDQRRQAEPARHAHLFLVFSLLDRMKSTLTRPCWPPESPCDHCSPSS